MKHLVYAGYNKKEEKPYIIIQAFFFNHTNENLQSGVKKVKFRLKYLGVIFTPCKRILIQE
ncbi:MAG TPA: hypothetical protein VEX17_02670 [Bacillales bacterium]|nr:hypothetical protein [Bacillales bacterium]